MKNKDSKEIKTKKVKKRKEKIDTRDLINTKEGEGAEVEMIEEIETNIIDQEEMTEMIDIGREEGHRQGRTEREEVLHLAVHHLVQGQDLLHLHHQDLKILQKQRRFKKSNEVINYITLIS